MNEIITVTKDAFNSLDFIAGLIVFIILVIILLTGKQMIKNIIEQDD